MLNLVIYFYPRRLPAPATFTRTRDLYPRVATPRHLDILLARFQKLRPKWDKMSHFSEFVWASKTFSDHVTRNASAAHNNEA